MSFFKVFTFSMLFLMSFFLVGCGGGGSANDANVTNLSLSLPITTTEVVSNNQVVDIEVRVFDENNTIYNTGNVNITYPSDGVNGRDIGSFASSSVAVSNGVATFTYIAPNDITTDTSDIVFKFYHDENPNEIKTYTITINPEQAALTNYNLNISDNNVTMDLESSKLITFSVTNDANILVEDLKMNYIKITSLNPNIGALEDSLGNTGNSLTITDKNSVTININSKTLSGVVPIKVETSILDANNNSIALPQKIFNVLVLSGPPSAMSISSSIGIIPVADKAKYKEQFVLTVTDKYGNLVNTKPAVSMGVLAGFAQASSSTITNNLNYLYVGIGTGGGTLTTTSNRFTAKTNIFDNVDVDNDVLVTFGTNDDGYTYNASGKWDIISKTSNSLFLSDDYSGADTSNLGFAVGHNYRQITCPANGEEAVANVYPTDVNDDINYIIPEDGSMTVNIEYDYYLVGKTVMLWVNLVGENHATSEVVKIGETKKIGLLGDGLSIYENGSNAYNAGDTGVVRIDIGVSGTNEYYRNGRFGYVIQASNDLNWTIVGDSMDNNLNSCFDNNWNVYNGIAYVDVNITSPAPSAGEITFKSLLPIIGGEF